MHIRYLVNSYNKSNNKLFICRYKPEYVQKEFYTGGHIEVNNIPILVIIKFV